MADNDTTSTIRIYPSFTEVRQQVSANAPQHELYVPQDLYNQILSGSLNLEGVNVQAFNAVLRENNLEGKTIHIVKNKQLRKVTMIRSRDNLVQDVETGRYYHADRSDIEFTEVPEETGTEVTFTVEKAGPATLSYLMNGINWKPRYSLNVKGDSWTLQGWADINNNTQKEYLIEKTELFGGDVNVVRSPHVVTYAAMECRVMMSDGPMARRAAPKVHSEGEVAGLYMYSIPERYILEARSTFSLPFVAPKVKLTRVATANSYFGSYNNKGQFTKVYRLSSDQFLPTGTVTVREDGRVVGQSNLADLSADEDYDLEVGNDPEVSYERSVKTLEHNENTSNYEVTVTVKNKKSRVINFEYNETFGGRVEAKGEEGDAKTTFENDRIQHTGVADAHANKVFKYSVRFFYN